MPPADMTDSAAPPPQGPTPTGIDIAVLDDDIDFRTYIDDLLRDEGHTVRTFEQPGGLYEACEEQLPDIVLLDMKMGEHKGEEVLEELQRRWQSLCVIVVTGYPSLEDMRRTFQMKVFDYLAKPFSIGQLRDTLRRAAEQFGLGRMMQDRLRERLGHAIKMMRVERGWSLKELSSAAHLSISQVSSIERGANLPSVESLVAICHAFGKRPSEVLAGIEF